MIQCLIGYFKHYRLLGDLKHVLYFSVTLNSNQKNPTSCLENKNRMKTNFIGCTSQKNCTDDQQSKWMHRDNLVFSALALAHQAKLLLEIEFDMFCCLCTLHQHSFLEIEFDTEFCLYVDVTSTRETGGFRCLSGDYFC